MLRASASDVDEVVFLLDGGGCFGERGGHPKVFTEEVNGGPFEAFGFVDGREGELGCLRICGVGEDVFDVLEEGFEGGGVSATDGETFAFVTEGFEGVRGELLGLFLEVFGDEDAELPRSGGVKLFGEVDKGVTDVPSFHAAFDSAS